MTEHADVVVVGMGPGGEGLAESLAEAGLDVLGVERELVGGECPYWGCIPSKMIVRAAETLAEARRVDQLAGAAQVHPGYAPVAQRIRAEATDNWDDTVAVQRFEKHGGRFIRGAGRLDGPGRVVVDGMTIEAGKGVVIATGTVPSIPPVPGLDGVGYWTNRRPVATEAVP